MAGDTGSARRLQHRAAALTPCAHRTEDQPEAVRLSPEAKACSGDASNAPRLTQLLPPCQLSTALLQNDGCCPEVSRRCKLGLPRVSGSVLKTLSLSASGQSAEVRMRHRTRWTYCMCPVRCRCLQPFVACCLLTLAVAMLLGVRHHLGAHLNLKWVAVKSVARVHWLDAAAGTAIPLAEERLFGAPLRSLLTLGDDVPALEPEAYSRWVPRSPSSTSC